jgi:hypothetical protein
MLVFLVLFVSLFLAMFLIKTAEIPDSDPDLESNNNFYRLKVHENLYDHINDNLGTVVLFLASWCDKSKKIKKLLDDKCDCNVIIVDERHPDSILARKFPSMYIYNGKVLEKGSIKQISDFLVS